MANLPAGLVSFGVDPKAAARVMFSSAQGNYRWRGLGPWRWEGLHRPHKSIDNGGGLQAEREQAMQAESELCCFLQLYPPQSHSDGGGGKTECQGGVGGCPQDLRSWSFKTAKITVITLTHHCPVQGPIPYKHLQCDQITRWGGVCERYMCTHVHACVYISLHVYVLFRCICFLTRNVQCRIVWQQPSWLAREEWLGAASLPVICPQEKDWE